jgi:hypothetical protein
MCTRSRLVLIAAVGSLGCGRDAREPTATRTAALTSTVVSDWDTFINSAFPDNNNGRSPSLFTGHNGQGGMMRALVQLRSLPREARGRVTVNRVRLTLITRGTGLNEDVPPTPATVSLQALTIPWEEGVGIGNAMTMFTVGQPCESNGNSTGATWNQPHCAAETPWAGGAVAAAVSGTASVPAALEATVTWDSASGNDGMTADVQRWIDDPDSNQGWRLASSTETDNFGAAQKFYSREEPGEKGPVLIVDYTCKAGYVSTGTACEPVDGGDGAAGAGGTGGAAGTTGGGGTGGGAAGTTGAGGTGGGTAGTTGAAGTTGGGGVAGTTGAGGTGGAAGTAGGGTGGATAGTSGGRGGTTGSAGSAAGRGGSGGGGTTGRGGSGGAGTAGTAGNGGDSGCSCAVGAREGGSRALGSLLAVVGIVLRKRRR